MLNPEKIEKRLQQIIEQGTILEHVILNVKNVDKLGNIKDHGPIRRIGNMGVFMGIDLQADDPGEVTARIRRDLLEELELDEEELWAAAKKNSAARLPMEIMTMEQHLQQAYGIIVPQEVGSGIWFAAGGKHGGARVVGYEGFWEAAAEKLGGSFILFPSSVYEVLMVRYRDDMDPADMTEMVREINQEEVPERDVLDDAAYIYDAVTKTVIRCG